MSRRRRTEPRNIPPDPIYRDELISKFINALMNDGKKGVAQGILYRAMEDLKRKESRTHVLELVQTAVENVKPTVEVKSRRVGGSTYQVPVEVRPERRQALSIRWIIQNAIQRKGRSMQEKLSAELLDAFHKRGNSMRKKEDIHRMAESNRAFAHYRW